MSSVIAFAQWNSLNCIYFYFSESELASSHEQWIHYLKSIQAEDLIGENELLFKFWLEIQRQEPSLIRLFDAFITNAGLFFIYIVLHARVYGGRVNYF